MFRQNRTSFYELLPTFAMNKEIKKFFVQNLPLFNNLIIFIMKKRILLASAAVIMVAANFSVFAQDITPSRYIFANQDEGPFKIDLAVAGWNGANGNSVVLAAYEADKEKGYVVLGGALSGFVPDGMTESTDALPLVALQQGCNIINLGGEVGKVLCIQGKNVDKEFGGKIGEGFQACDMGLLLNSVDGVNTRVKIVYQQYNPNKLADKTTKSFKFMVKTNGGVAKPSGDGVQATTYNNFAKNITPDDWDETWAFDETKWASVEFDYSLGTAFPYRLSISIPGTVNDDVILIKEISIIQGSDGTLATDAKKEMLTLTPATSIEKALANLNEKISVSVIGNNVIVSNLNAGESLAIYNVNGSLVDSFVATDTSAKMTLDSGLYLVKAQNRTAKVLVK